MGKSAREHDGSATEQDARRLSDILGPAAGDAVGAGDLSYILSDKVTAIEVVKTKGSADWLSRLALVKDGSIPTPVLPNSPRLRNAWPLRLC